MGEWDVDRLADEMPAALFEEWRRYAGEEPFGDEWRQAGTVAAAVANFRPFRGKDSKPVRAEDFVPGLIRRATAVAGGVSAKVRAKAGVAAAGGRVFTIKPG